MSSEEVSIDFDEIDRLKAEEAEKSKKTDAKKVDAEPKIEVVKEEPERKPKAEIVKPEDGLEKLKKQLDDEKIARQNAETRAREAAESEVRAKTEVLSTQVDIFTSAIASLKQSDDMLEQKYAEALTAQDYPAAAKVQREMANNAAKLMTLEEGKKRVESAPKPAVRPPSDPLDQFTAQLSRRSADCVRAHPDYVRDAAKNREMIAAHEIAVARGHKVDSDEYFRSVEKTLELELEQEQSIVIDPDPPEAATKPTRRASLAAAPVTRSGNGAGNRPNVVTLSSQEVEMAQMMQMTPEEYARHKVSLKREGRIN